MVNGSKPTCNDRSSFRVWVHWKFRVEIETDESAHYRWENEQQNAISSASRPWHPPEWMIRRVCSALPPGVRIHVLWRWIGFKWSFRRDQKSSRRYVYEQTNWIERCKPAVLFSSNQPLGAYQMTSLSLIYTINGSKQTLPRKATNRACSRTRNVSIVDIDYGRFVRWSFLSKSCDCLGDRCRWCYFEGCKWPFEEHKRIG